MQQLPLEPVRVKDILVDADELPPFRYDRGKLTGLKASIVQLGLLVPPVVWHTTDAGRDRWVVIDGSRRVAALQELRSEYEDVDEDEKRTFPLQSIHVAVFRGTLVEAERLSAILHLCVAQNNRGDEAVASWWLESRGSRQADIAKLTDRVQTWVSHSKRFARYLAAPVMEQFRRRESIITAKHAHELVKLVTPDGKPDLARQLQVVDAIPPLEGRKVKKRGRVGRGQRNAVPTSETAPISRET